MWSRYFQTNWPTLPPEHRCEGGAAVPDARFRAIAGTIARLAEIGPDDRVLDLGCSIGAITRELARRCREVVGVDFVADSIAHARAGRPDPNVEFLCADLATFEIVGPFDCIVLNNVIHQLDSRAIARRLLRRCFGRLTPRGRLFLGEVPDTRKLWRYARAAGRGPRVYAHELLPGWAFPVASRALGRPLNKLLWFNRRRIARAVGCPADRVAVHDRPEDLLNPVDRSHFVVSKG